MRDPHLVEIDFLMDLERERQLTIIGYSDWDKASHVYAGAATRNRTQGQVQLYGTDLVRFREMINGLVLEWLISGSSYYGTIAGLLSLGKGGDGDGAHQSRRPSTSLGNARSVNA
jgi:hypothetical protein